MTETDLEPFEEFFEIDTFIDKCSYCEEETIQSVFCKEDDWDEAAWQEYCKCSNCGQRYYTTRKGPSHDPVWLYSKVETLDDIRTTTG